MDGGEVVAGFALHWRCHRLETGEALGIVHALFEEVELWLTDAHLSVHFKQALSCIVEWIIAYWLKLEVLGMASKQRKCLSFGLLGVTLIH